MQPEKLDKATEEQILSLVADMRSLGILRLTNDFLSLQEHAPEVWMATFDGDRKKFIKTEEGFIRDET